MANIIDKVAHEGGRNNLITRVLEEVLRRRVAGEAISNDEVCSNNNELLPELRLRLEALTVIEVAERRAKGDDDFEPLRDFTLTSGKTILLDQQHDDNVRSESRYPNMGDYEIVGVLGQGGMGVVYSAVQIKLDRTVALKVLPSIIGAASPSAVARFQREAAAAARLHHTNIVPVYDFGESEDGYYFAMELVEGQPLDEVIRRLRDSRDELPADVDLTGIVKDLLMPGANADRAPAPANRPQERNQAYYRRVARIFADAANALDYAHGEGVIHRDIKPSNLLLTTEGRLVVADFGLAKTVDEQTITRPGAMLGTILYISPEQAVGDWARVDHRTDIYSIGVTLFEMLCLRPVFKAGDDKQLLASIIQREPPRLRKLVPSVPAELEVICLKALEKDPDARYQTAGEFADDLKRFATDLPITAKRPSVFKRVLKFSKRHKAAVIAVTAILLLVVSGFTVAHLNRVRAEADVDAMIQKGVRLMTAPDRSVEDLEEAASQFEQILQRDPVNLRAHGNLAITKKELFNTQDEPDRDLLLEAEIHCREALKLQPAHTGLLNTRGVILKMLGRYDEAVTVFQEIITIDGEFVEALNNLAISQTLAGDLDDAIKSLEDACEITGSDMSCDAVTWRTLGALLAVQGDPRAVECLQQAINCDRKDEWARILRSRFLLGNLSADDIELALLDAKMAVDVIDPVPAVFLRVRALAHLRDTDFEKAMADAVAAIDAGDELSPNQLIIAAAQSRVGNMTAARSAYDQAMMNWPKWLSEKNSVHAAAPRGILWLESEAELASLATEVEGLMTRSEP